MSALITSKVIAGKYLRDNRCDIVRRTTELLQHEFEQKTLEALSVHAVVKGLIEAGMKSDGNGRPDCRGMAVDGHDLWIGAYLDKTVRHQFVQRGTRS